MSLDGLDYHRTVSAQSWPQRRKTIVIAFFALQNLKENDNALSMHPCPRVKRFLRGHKSNVNWYCTTCSLCYGRSFNSLIFNTFIVNIFPSETSFNLIINSTEHRTSDINKSATKIQTLQPKSPTLLVNMADQLHSQNHQNANNFLGSLPTIKLEDLPENSQSCHICKEPFDDPNQEAKSEVAVMLPCNHIMGSECLSKWFEGNNTCPMCRAILFRRAVSSAEPQGAASLVWAEWPRQPSLEEQSEVLQSLEADSLELERLLAENIELLVRLNAIQAASHTEENRAEVSRMAGRFVDIDARVDEIRARIRGMRLQGGNAR